MIAAISAEAHKPNTSNSMRAALCHGRFPAAKAQHTSSVCTNTTLHTSVRLGNQPGRWTVLCDPPKNTRLTAKMPAKAAGCGNASKNETRDESNGSGRAPLNRGAVGRRRNQAAVKQASPTENNRAAIDVTQEPEHRLAILVGMSETGMSRLQMFVIRQGLAARARWNATENGAPEAFARHRAARAQANASDDRR